MCGWMVLMETRLSTAWNWQRYFKSLSLRRHMEAEDILVKQLLFRLGVQAFANCAADGCPIFPSVKYVHLVNPQPFLTSHQGLVSWSMLCQQLGWRCCWSMFFLPLGHFLVTSNFQAMKIISSRLNHISPSIQEDLGKSHEWRGADLSFGSFKINSLGISKDWWSICRGPPQSLPEP